MTANADPTPAATVRAIYVAGYTVAQNFGDIGYHLLVDQQGGVDQALVGALTRCPYSAPAAAAR